MNTNTNIRFTLSHETVLPPIKLIRRKKNNVYVNPQVILRNMFCMWFSYKIKKKCRYPLLLRIKYLVPGFQKAFPWFGASKNRLVATGGDIYLRKKKRKPRTGQLPVAVGCAPYRAGKAGSRWTRCGGAC